MNNHNHIIETAIQNMGLPGVQAKLTTKVSIVFNGITKIFNVEGCDFIIGITDEGDLVAKFGNETRIIHGEVNA